MGEPISQLNVNRESSVQKNIREHLLKGKKLTSETARSTGLDIEMLESFLKGLAPQLPYLSGYKSLDELHRVQHRTGRAGTTRRRKPIDAIHQDQLIKIDSTSYRSPTIKDGDYESMYFDIYLCRTGKWIVEWYSYTIADSGAMLFETVRDAITFIYERSEKYALCANLESPRAPSESKWSLAIHLIHNLLYYTLGDTINRRQKQLDSMKQLAKSGDDLINRVEVIYPR